MSAIRVTAYYDSEAEAEAAMEELEELAGQERDDYISQKGSNAFLGHHDVNVEGPVAVPYDARMIDVIEVENEK